MPSQRLVRTFPQVRAAPRPPAPRLAVATGIALALPLALAACKKPPPPPPPPPEVGVVTLREEPVTLTAELPGRTTGFETSDVRPQVNGIIKARLFSEGSDVRAGQVLYQIDPAPYRAALDQARGQLANAQANVVTARLKAQRYADLVKINAVSKQDADDAQAAYGQAAANVQQYAAAVQSARINLGYTSVTAPISGRIGRALVTAGALVASQQTTALATIQRLDPIYVDLVQSADDVLRLKRDLAKGQLSGAGADSARVRLTLSDGSAYPQEGVLKLSEAQVDQTTGSVTLRAIFPNPNKLLLPGMFVRAQIIEGVDNTGILAPQPGITRDPKGNATAMVVDAQGKAEARSVVTGQAFGDKWLIVSGLKAGDRLITEGLINVHAPGTPVRAVPAGSKPQGPPPGAGGAAGGGKAGGSGGEGASPAPRGGGGSR